MVCIATCIKELANLYSSFLGAISTFGFGERLGRKKTLLVGVTIMSVGAILQTCAFSVAQMIVARLITGKLQHFIQCVRLQHVLQALEMGL